MGGLFFVQYDDFEPRTASTARRASHRNLCVHVLTVIFVYDIIVKLIGTISETPSGGALPMPEYDPHFAYIERNDRNYEVDVTE